MVATGFRLLSLMTPQERRTQIYRLVGLGLLKVARETESGEMYMHCPFHADRHPSASYNYYKNVFNCFVCGGMSGDAFLERLISEGLKNKKMLPEFKLQDKRYQVSEEDLMPITEKFRSYREISGTFLQKMGLRYVPKWDAIYIPFFVNGNVEGYQLRFLSDYVIVDGKSHKVPKYYNVLPQKTLYGYDWVEYGQSFVLVEGVFDALQLIYRGIRAMAVLGSDVTDYQIYLIKQKRPKVVIVWLDEEPHIFPKKKKLTYRLLQEGIKATLYVAIEKGDPDELGRDIICKDYQVLKELLRY